MADSLYQVYVLRNAAGRFYIGLGEDVSARLLKHNQGLSTWTRTRGPWTLACARKTCCRRLATSLASYSAGRMPAARYGSWVESQSTRLPVAKNLKNFPNFHSDKCVLICHK